MDSVLTDTLPRSIPFVGVALISSCIFGYSQTLVLSRLKREFS